MDTHPKKETMETSDAIPIILLTYLLGGIAFAGLIVILRLILWLF